MYHRVLRMNFIDLNVERINVQTLLKDPHTHTHTHSTQLDTDVWTHRVRSVARVPAAVVAGDATGYIIHARNSSPAKTITTFSLTASI